MTTRLIVSQHPLNATLKGMWGFFAGVRIVLGRVVCISVVLKKYSYCKFYHVNLSTFV